MRNLVRRVTAAGLCLAFLLSSGCAKKKKDSSENVVKETDPFFDATEYDMEPGSDEGLKLKYMSVSMTRVFATRAVTSYDLEYVMPEDIADLVSRYQMSPNTLSEEDLKKAKEAIAKYQQSGAAVFDLEGHMKYKIKFQPDSQCAGYFEKPDGRLSVCYSVWDDKKYTNAYYIGDVSEDGTIQNEIALDTNDLYADSYSVLEDGNLLCVGPYGVQKFDKNGKSVGRVNGSDYLEKLLNISGKCYGVFINEDPLDYDNSYTYLLEFDPAACKFAKNKTEMKSGMSPSFLCQGDDGKLYSTIGNGLQSYDLLTGNPPEKVFDWSEMDICNYGIDLNSFRFLSSDEFYFVRNTYEKSGADTYGITHLKLVHIKRAEKNPHAGKTIITVAASTYPGEPFIEHMVEYNRDPSKKSRIVVRDYSAEELSSMESAAKAKASIADKVYLDMVSGNGADILLDFGGYTQFQRSDILVDLNTLIDGSEALDRSRYFDNVFRAFETDGKLFNIPVSFRLSGMVGNKEYIGDKTAWDLDEFNKTADSLPDKVTMITDVPWTELLTSLMRGSSFSFVNYDQKKVDFDNPQFRQILEATKKYGSSRTRSQINSTVSYDSPENPEKLLDEGALALVSETMYDLYSFSVLATKCGGNIAFPGAPSAGKLGMAAVEASTFSIAKSSPHQEEAWAFIRFMFEDEPQYSVANANLGFSVNRATFDRMMNEEIKNNQDFRAREGTERLGYEIELNEELASRLKSVIENIHARDTFDPAIMLIINEEVPGFFNDQRSLDDVVRIIQNRCTTVVQERG